MFGLGKKYEYDVVVEGMKCVHCLAHVEEAIAKVDGVKTAKGSLETKTIHVVAKTELSEAAIKEAVESVGKTFVSIAAK
ncbi:MAG: heavy-metal-associated domain-containing protein [Bacilli bacterium]|nr:heavy-metal-associated domain-containing protein [Bacilli bacterium]